jgi:hypothetical protein
MQMTTLELTLNLPDELAQQTSDALRSMWARQAPDDITPALEQEIVATVKTVRAEQRTAQ